MATKVVAFSSDIAPVEVAASQAHIYGLRLRASKITVNGSPVAPSKAGSIEYPLTVAQARYFLSHRASILTAGKVTLDVAPRGRHSKPASTWSSIEAALKPASTTSKATSKASAPVAPATE